MIQSFSEKTKKTFPQLEEYFTNLNKINENPSDFYAQLTAAINKARQGTTNYLNELKRIQQNMLNNQRTLQNYKADDFRYRLNGDIQSFLNRLTGNFTVRTEKSLQTEANQIFAVRVQNLTIKILKKLGLIERISSGEDFSAIAASLLIQIESEIQKEVDKSLLNGKNIDLDKEIDGIFKLIEDRYERLANKQRLAESPIDKALTNIESIEFKRITENAKDILNISSDLSQDEKKLHDKIQSREKRLKNNSGVKRNQEIKKMRDTVKENSQLNKNLNFVKFSISGTEKTKHGNINELILSILTNGTKVSGNAATDIITFMFNGDLQVDHSIMNELMSNIGQVYTQTISQQTPGKNDPEIKDTTQLMISMNEKITELIKATEKKIQEQNNFDLDNIFIFHESLKLHSSVETGRSRHSGFEGRKLSIMSYIDNLYSMSSSTTFPLSREDLGFIAINLMPGAAAADFKDPLEKYLSLYAGMVMFDDLGNMAQEAIAAMVPQNSSGKITQIHLYNLNGIYVPASMILTYISEAVSNTTTMIDSGYAAKATITVPTSNETYSAYMSARKTSENLILTQDTWKAVAAENNRNTKITITFLAAFKAFIEKLNSI